MDKYYVQTIARNYLKNILDVPSTLNVHERFLCSLDDVQFKEGFSTLVTLIEQLYNDIISDPADFGMLLKENNEEDAKNTDYTNSNASFLRMPNLLAVIGAFSTLESDMFFNIDGGILNTEAKKLKISAVPFLLNKLKNYGFEISDFGKSLKTGEIISISYPDNRFLLVALKAISEAHVELNKGDIKNPKHSYFYMMHSGLLENEIVKEPKLTIDNFLHTLSPGQYKQAMLLHEVAVDVAKQKIRMGGFMRNDWACTYTDNKSKKVLMTLHVNQSSFSAKLNLQYIGQYISLVNEMPDDIKDAIIGTGWDCGSCNPKCSGGFAFELNGKAYNKCHCGSFMFNDINDENIVFCKQLLIKEIELRNH